jgi:hypothetical protein
VQQDDDWSAPAVLAGIVRQQMPNSPTSIELFHHQAAREYDFSRGA